MEVKYQRIAEVAALLTKAEAVVLVVLNGKDGSGYSVHASSEFRELLPAITRHVANKISPEESVSDLRGFASTSDPP